MGGGGERERERKRETFCLLRLYMLSFRPLLRFFQVHNIIANVIRNTLRVVRVRVAP